MTVEHLGDTWTPDDAEVVPPGGWVHVAPLLRSDFPAETLAALARGRHLSFDGQGLVRAAEPGPLRLDANFDPAMLEHVQILKLAEEEAEVVGAIDTLGVPEVLVTFGERGSRVYYKGRSEKVGAWPVAVRPDRLRRRLLRCLPRGQGAGSGAGVGSTAGDRRRRGAADRARMT